MPDLSTLAESMRTTLGQPLAIVAGGLLLLFGRRLYWLLAGVVGFVVVFTVAGRLVPEMSEQVTLLVSLGAGVLGSIVTVFAHKALLGLVGGLGGALIGLWQAQALGLEQGVLWLVAAVVGGLLGAWLVSRLFEFALALLSSLLGAQLLVDAFGVTPSRSLLTYLGLVGFGLFFQLLRKQRKKRKKREKKLQS
ncbi:MAG: hypothetical protein O7A98_04945 [Acidobacteria bacterium]|nr:hypothetical protein [Acidobacteriota bacterium]